MIKTTIEIKDSGDFKEFLKAVTNGKDAFVTVGVHEDAGQYTDSDATVSEVALWNEYGTKRGTWGGNGIPERSFFRSAVDNNDSKISGFIAQSVGKIADSVKNPKTTKGVVKHELDSIGFKLQVLIQNQIKSNTPPPNAPATVEAKRKKGVAPRTLIDSGLLLRSVTHKTVVK